MPGGVDLKSDQCRKANDQAADSLVTRSFFKLRSACHRSYCTC